MRSSIYPDGRPPDPAPCCPVGLGSLSCSQLEPGHWPTAVGLQALEVSSGQYFAPSRCCPCPTSQRELKQMDPEAGQMWLQAWLFGERQTLSSSCPLTLHCCYHPGFAFAKRDRCHSQLYQLKFKFLKYEFC